MEDAEPSTLDEARGYVGRKVAKQFEDPKLNGTRRWYRGSVREVWLDDGITTYNIKYDSDDDAEDVVWSGLCVMMRDARHVSGTPGGKRSGGGSGGGGGGGRARVKRERSEAGGGGGEDGEGPGDGERDSDQARHAAAAKRRRSSKPPPAPAADEERDDGGARRGSGSGARGGKQQRPQQRQRQQQADAEDEELEDSEEDLEGPAPRKAQQRRRGQQQQQPRRRQQQEEEGDSGEGSEQEEGEEGEGRLLNEEERISRAVTAHAAGGAARRGAVRPKGLAGHVKSIKVVNFMCHENFEMEFSSHVNFISGQNGSGKSAVLQALQICLGATARETGRGRSLRELIKSGAPAAMVRVTLWNTGGDAYKHDKFGDWVTIERTLAASGAADGVSSTFKISGEKGPVAGANRRNTIEPLLDHLNIAVENPLCVMTQDKAREFLCSARNSWQLLYKLFMDATLMADFRNNLDTAEGRLVQMREKVKEISDGYVAKEAELASLRARLEKLRQSRQLQADRDKLELAAAWALVREREAEVGKCDRALAEMAASKRSQWEARVTELDETLALLQEEQQQLKEQQLAQNRFASDVLAGLQQLQNEATTAHRGKRQAEAARDKSKDTFAATQREMQQMEESIAQATQQTGSARSAEILRQLEQQRGEEARLRGEVERLKREVAAAEGQHRDYTAQCGQLEDEGNALDQDIRALQQTVTRLDSECRHLAGSSSNGVVRFGGQSMVKLCDLVQRNARRFKQPPIGPIGAQLSLTDQRWNVAAESVLGVHLNKWIVCCREDERELRSLMQQVGINPNIIVKRFDAPPYVIPRNVTAAVRHPYLRLRDLVVIEHEQQHLIDNVLIDVARYERVAVAESQNEARDVVYNNALGDLINIGVAVDGMKATRSGPGGLLSMNMWRSNRPPSLGSNVASLLADTKAMLAAKRNELVETQQKQRQVQQELQRVKQASQQAYTRTRELRMQLNRAASALHAMQQQSEAKALEAATQGAVEEGDEMQAQVNALKAEVAGARRALDDMEAELQEATQREARAQTDLEERRQQVEAAKAAVEAAKEKLAAVGDQLADAGRERSHLQRKLDNLEAGAAQVRQRRDQLAAEAEERRREALQHCTEEEGDEALAFAQAQLVAKMRLSILKSLSREQKALPEGEREALVAARMADASTEVNPEVVVKLCEFCERRISQAQQDAGGSITELQAQEHTLAAAVQKDTVTVTNVREVFRSTKAALEQRQDGYQKLFDSVEKHVNAKFLSYMQRRKYRGQLKINQEREELRLLVKTSQQDKGAGGSERAKADRAVTDLKELSGGERSYTNVSFMLALGEYVEAPFRCMDEYDVFMDAVNRRIATETLLQNAFEKDNVQHIFLTPQDISAITDARRHLEKKNGVALGEGFLKIMQLRPARA